MPTQDDDAKMREAENFYASLVAYTEFLFNDSQIKNHLDIHSIFERVKLVYQSIRYDINYLMRALHGAEPGSDENYIFTHSVRTSIVAMVMGLYLRLPNHRLIELGVASLLHDIGMLSLPRERYFNDRIFTDEDKALIQTHPILGYNLLQLNKFPPSVKLAVLEHHERENGSGYPQGLKGESISLFGKIIAVSCSYESISAKRLHKEQKDYHTGILELLKNDEKQYDKIAIRALIYSLSIYPLGSHVLLSNGKKGQVVDVNPENPRYPIVMLFDNNASNEKDIPVIQTSPDNISIVRPLNQYGS